MFTEEKRIIRAGCHDLWNAFMVDGATFTANDIPICPATTDVVPRKLISYAKAKTLFNERRKTGELDFFKDAYVHFYIDDQKFDGKRSGIWSEPWKAWEILRHFAGIITPDFSTYADFPFPIKCYNTYRMRAFGYWYGKNGGAVINNVRWGKAETFAYCFDGIPRNSIVAIGTVASGLRNATNLKNFSAGFRKMLTTLTPQIVIVYGSDNYSVFDEVRQEVKIVCFRSEKDLALRSEINE